MASTSTDSAASSSLLSGSLWKALVALTGPMLVSGALQEVQSLIDLFWVGRLGEELEAVVQDAWGQYRWPWIGYQRGLLSEMKPAKCETKTQATLF